MDNVLLIIIDQLRADYGKYMPKCAKLLPYHAVCDTNSIPTSTEAMHANISTGRYPKEHGFISKDTKDGKIGLDQIIKRLDSNQLSSLAALGTQYGFDFYVLGGKPQVVKILCSKEECQLRTYYDKRFIVEEDGSSLIKDIGTILNQGCIDHDSLGEFDSRLVEAFNYLISKKSDKRFITLSLPSLDYIGHKFGPGSDQVISHLRYLDDNLSNIIEKICNNTHIILAGDHGCRQLNTYLIESENNPNNLIVYHREEPDFIFSESYQLDKEGNFENIKYDGGSLRIWLKDSCSLSNKDTNFLQSYSQIYDLRRDNDFGHELQQIYENSIHENLGDVLVIADPETIFCRESWIVDTIRENRIPSKSILGCYDLPLGEHGTPYPEDRETHFMSNYNFERNKITNIEIRKFIENLFEFIG